MTNPDGPLVEEVRQRRHEISAEHDHDIRRYGEHLMKWQERFADRLVDQITVVRSSGDGTDVHENPRD